MKRLVLFLGITVAISAITWALPGRQQPPEKKYKVEFTIVEWNHIFAAIEMSKSALKRSDIPSKDMVFINDSLMVPIQSAFVQQINLQLEAEKAAQQKKADTTKPKKN
jgi:hypothetical protein